MRHFFNQPAGLRGQDYAEQSDPQGLLNQANSAAPGINSRSALWVLCRCRHNGHWTSHEKRCNRQLGKRFGDDAYAMEELVAELGAAFLCAELGVAVKPRADHAQYLASWLNVLKADKRAVFTAASAASKAAEFLNGLVRPSPS